VHYTDSREDFNPKDLKVYLESKNLSNIHIDKTVATIEDTFMELAK
jgi:hypothetical protein